MRKLCVVCALLVLAGCGLHAQDQAAQWEAALSDGWEAPELPGYVREEQGSAVFYHAPDGSSFSLQRILAAPTVFEAFRDGDRDTLQRELADTFYIITPDAVSQGELYEIDGRAVFLVDAVIPPCEEMGLTEEHAVVACFLPGEQPVIFSICTISYSVNLLPGIEALIRAL